MQIEIVDIPVGEAPLWVRKAWIGTVIPLAHDELQIWHTVGVFSGPPTKLRRLWNYLTRQHSTTTGYLVVKKVAVDQLAVNNIEAAEWWRANTPNSLDGIKHFVFDAEACQVVCDS